MSKRILVAEDQDDLRSIIGLSLGSEGYEVATARDGLEALEIARRRPPDIVVTNLDMPRLDGLELIRRLRADLHLHNVPVIILSGTGHQHAEAIIRAGAYEFLCKPFDLALLAECVKLALNEAATSSP